MAIDSGFEALGSGFRESRPALKRICGALTASGSICRAAPMANGRCAHHGGRVERDGFYEDEEGAMDGASEAPPPDLREAIDRLGTGLDLVTSLSAELPLAARQLLVPELRAFTAKTLRAYKDLLARNRREAHGRRGNAPIQ